MRITLNLATRPFVDMEPRIKLLRVTLVSLAVIAASLGLSLIVIHQKAEQARARERLLDSQIAHITQERQGYKMMMQRPENAELLIRIGELNQILDEKAFSWTLAMENLETVLPGGVQVSTLEPVRAKDGHITLHLRVDGPHDRSVDLVRNLEHSRRFLQPRIVGESSAETSSGPNQRLEPVSASNRFDFDLLAEYNPPSPGETRLSAHSKPNPGSDDSEIAPANSAQDSQFAEHRARSPYTGPAPKPSPSQGGPQ